MKTLKKISSKLLFGLAVVLLLPAIIIGLPGLLILWLYDHFFQLFGFDPYEAQKKREEEEIKAAAEKQNKIYYFYPQMKDFSQADYFLETIENPDFLVEIREEAYAWINGITPAGQQKRYPMVLSINQQDRLLNLIVREKFEEIKFQKEHLCQFEDQLPLLYIFHHAELSEIRGWALYKLAVKEVLLRRLIFFIKGEADFMGLSAPDFNDEQRKHFLDEIVKIDENGITYVLPDRSTHPDLWEFMEASGLSKLKNKEWKAFTREEIHEFLILSQNKVLEYVKKFNSLSGCAWDDAEDNIKELIKWMNDPDFILHLGNDPDLSDFNASELIQILFKDFFDETDDIENIRDRAVNTYFEMNRDIDDLDFRIPDKYHRKYGIMRVKEDHISINRFGKPYNSNFKVIRITNE